MIRRRGRPGGFSLLEVIAAIVLAAVLAALLVPLIGSGLRGNLAPAHRLQDAYALRSEMDFWVNEARTTYAGDLPGLSTAIDDGAGPGSYTVIHNDWVVFDLGGNEVATPGNTANLLKVTLGHAQGNRLTIIFAPQPSAP